MSKTVALFAGHGISQDGSWDSGATWNGHQEAKMVQLVARSAAYYLKKSGIKVITDYEKNDINMVAQVRKANAAHADLFVSVHMDWEKAPAGTIPLYTSAAGRKLAASMNKSVMYYSSLKTRGLARRTDLYELNATNMVACIFEVGSIKADYYTVKREYDFIGFGMAKGICRYLGVTFKCPQLTVLKRARGLEPAVVKNLHYNGKATNITYGTALKGNKQVNCALYVSWILQRAGILNFHSRIWLGDAVHGSGKGQLEKACKITHPKKLPKDIVLHVADIVGYQWGSSKANKVHTMIVLRYDNGRPVFATCGGSDLKAKDLSRKRATYERKPIKTLCRIK